MPGFPNRVLGTTAACLLLSLAALGSVGARERSGPDRDAEPSPCITEASLRLTASPATVLYGQSSRLSWAVTVPRHCTGVSITVAGALVGRNGSRQVAPSANSQYHLVVSQTRLGVRSQTSASAQVAVTYPERVVIAPDTPTPAKLLAAAVAAEGVRTIELRCGVEIDMTGLSQLTLSGHSIIASPGCERSLSRPGPLIYVTDERRNLALFDVRGDRVALSGFRLRGPTDYLANGDRKETAIRIVPFSDHPPIEAIEISNMEIFHWSGAAIDVRDAAAPGTTRGRLTNARTTLQIRNNHIHHNRHGAGFGYGVNVGYGAYALIERNAFDENRHAISGDSSNGAGDYSGYTARDNLILSGGGRHCTDSLISICWQTHQIDMHGEDSTVLGGDYCCGIAGETMLIERNTVLYDAGYAIKIRGNPTDKAVVDGNAFRLGSQGSAIAQNGDTDGDITRPIQVRPNNRYGIADPTTRLGRCDFDGDGTLDEFMTTGVTWWARSTAQPQWRYLNTQPQMLAQLELRDMDGDRICDVVRTASSPLGGSLRKMYSRSGTGAWTYFSEVER
ncbi:hypothetical protein DX914_03165 [Lysobacter silvisoli]|uniref:Right handed beta helix domain-containing protein n=2 Tax=Lysobacter silvisoli TaxID=2293254 RepID=A0A371K2P0_9GAMM|nr:hypothetical protein DX914_03165 [Lysobacter silvisoli]